MPGAFAPVLPVSTPDGEYCRHFYTHLTNDSKARLAQHNAGEVTHTAKYRPWRIKTAMVFGDRTKAATFDAYLKPSPAAFSPRNGCDVAARKLSITDSLSRPIMPFAKEWAP